MVNTWEQAKAQAFWFCTLSFSHWKEHVSSGSPAGLKMAEATFLNMSSGFASKALGAKVFNKIYEQVRPKIIQEMSAQQRVGNDARWSLNETGLLIRFNPSWSALCRSQRRMVRTVGKNECSTLSEIAGKANKSFSSVSKTVLSLEKKGFLVSYSRHGHRYVALSSFAGM